MSILKNKEQATSQSIEESNETLGLILWKISLAWQRTIKKTLDSYDLSHPQFIILQILLESHETQKNKTQIDIARYSKLDKMTISKSLKKLGSLGLTTRHENEKDPRAKSVLLTEKGKKIIEVLEPTIKRIDKGFFNALNDHKQSELKSLLTLLKD